MADIENISLSLTDDLTKADKTEYNKLVSTGLTSPTLPTEYAQSPIDVEVKVDAVPHKPKAIRSVQISKDAK